MTLTTDDVERRTRAMFEATNSSDPQRIVELYSGGVGFGYRSRGARPPYDSKDAHLQALQAGFAAMDFYRIAIDEIHTAVDGDIGVAWGFYTEEFQLRGGHPQVVHGRFSEVMKRDAAGWHTLFYHRDATPFDSQGRYIPATKAAS